MYVAKLFTVQTWMIFDKSRFPCLFAVPLFIVWSVINSVAWGYGSTQALPWTTILFLMSFWFVSKLSDVCHKSWTCFCGFCQVRTEGDKMLVIRQSQFDASHFLPAREWMLQYIYCLQPLKFLQNYKLNSCAPPWSLSRIKFAQTHNSLKTLSSVQCLFL